MRDKAGNPPLLPLFFETEAPSEFQPNDAVMSVLSGLERRRLDVFDETRRPRRNRDVPPLQCGAIIAVLPGDVQARAANFLRRHFHLHMAIFSVE